MFLTQDKTWYRDDKNSNIKIWRKSDSRIKRSNATIHSEWRNALIQRNAVPLRGPLRSSVREHMKISQWPSASGSDVTMWQSFRFQLDRDPLNLLYALIFRFFSLSFLFPLQSIKFTSICNHGHTSVFFIMRSFLVRDSFSLIFLGFAIAITVVPIAKRDFSSPLHSLSLLFISTPRTCKDFNYFQFIPKLTIGCLNFS